MLRGRRICDDVLAPPIARIRRVAAMMTFVLAFVLIALSVLGMAVGVLLGRAPIAGSCGGLGTDAACAACPRVCSRRSQRRPQAEAHIDAEG